MTGVIELDPAPESVGEARAWVVDELAALGREDLSDSAELGVSELVTNAILHARPPIVVRLGGTKDHPRVEVHDNSVVPPTLRDMTDEERLLATVGRGLGIVAMFSETWGSEVSANGKVVWFEPAREPVLDADGHPQHHGEVYDLSLVVQRRLDERDAGDDRITVRLLGMPVRVFEAHRTWYEEVRRELRLLSVNHGAEYPLASELSEIAVRVEEERRQASGVGGLDKAVAAGLDRADLEYVVPASAGETMPRLLELLLQVDEFCREQRLLTLEPTPQLLALREWYLGEFGRQARGEAPRPWTGGYTVEP
ncbi:MAG: ATP-binding protein [Nocardioidaceae bacterium]|nr:ATP-binding protein [Nocardioidaceae bacterium]